MTTRTGDGEAALNGLRVLVVDNDEILREQTVSFLRHWGCVPVAAAGKGEGLLADARRLVAAHCCQLALVDMRLLDDSDNGDISGLTLAPGLAPAAPIIMSSYGDAKTVSAAFRDYDVFDFVPKADGPEALEAALTKVAEAQAIGARHVAIEWTDGLNSRALRSRLFEHKPNVPDDEADDLIGRMFPDAKRIVLSPLTNEPPPSDLPLSPDARPSLRRESRVFLAQIDSHPALMVIKIAKREKIEREIENYKKYVDNGTPNLFRPELRCKLLLWNMGAIGYRFVGNSDTGAGTGPRAFTELYRETADPDQILKPLRHFFERGNWGHWYQNEVKALGKALFTAYDAMLRHKLSRHFPDWQRQSRQMAFPGLARQLPNPFRWLSDNHGRSSEVLQPRQAVTHGDLHGDNLFVSDSHAWPIDFERSGPGPILRDFIELIQDILTRAAQFGDADVLVVYDLAVAVCQPSHPGQKMQLTERIQHSPDALKVFRVVQGLQQLAADLAHHGDQREYLWGLLLNHLFVLARISDQPHMIRYRHTALMASVICKRLEVGLRHRPWPPASWPAVSWLDDAPGPAGGHSARGDPGPPALVAKRPGARARFAQGHALLVGVGGSLPGTVDDATALYKLLTDPDRCAYPPEQVTLLTGASATRDAIVRGLQVLSEAAAADPQAVVTVYFSGHGVRGATRSYLLLHDYEPHRVAETALSGAEFTAALQTIGGSRLLVLLDCCHAGGMADVKGAPHEPVALPAELLSLGQGGGRVVIASSRRDEISYAGRPYSVFTQALREALAGYGAAEPDGYAYVADVALYVGRKVPERTSGKQHPILKLAAADNFPIAYYAGGEYKPKQLPGADGPPAAVFAAS